LDAARIAVRDLAACQSRFASLAEAYGPPPDRTNGSLNKLAAHNGTVHTETKEIQDTHEELLQMRTHYADWRAALKVLGITRDEVPEKFQVSMYDPRPYRIVERALYQFLCGYLLPDRGVDDRPRALSDYPYVGLEMLAKEIDVVRQTNPELPALSKHHVEGLIHGEGYRSLAFSDGERALLREVLARLARGVEVSEDLDKILD